MLVGGGGGVMAIVSINKVLQNIKRSLLLFSVNAPGTPSGRQHAKNRVSSFTGKYYLLNTMVPIVPIR